MKLQLGAKEGGKTIIESPSMDVEITADLGDRVVLVTRDPEGRRLEYEVNFNDAGRISVDHVGKLPAVFKFETPNRVIIEGRAMPGKTGGKGERSERG